MIRKRVLVTGGAGFIGGSVVRRLLKTTNAMVISLDKLGYCSDTTGIQDSLAGLGTSVEERYRLLQVDLAHAESVAAAVKEADPDLILHLAAESHVDRSIDDPEKFLMSNVCGTFSLLQAARSQWESLPESRQRAFRFHHISTDEVFGSLGSIGSFTENTPYDPRSPYSATKAASDHLVMAWHHTYELPVVLTNCSNNFGPWQFPEKLIPVAILKAVSGEPIPLYGDGSNVRDWLFVEDHVDALLLVAMQGRVGERYCVGGHGERTNRQVVEAICTVLDQLHPQGAPHDQLIELVEDRPGHDRRYAIDSFKISNELGWKPNHDFQKGLESTVSWYLAHLGWCQKVREQTGYDGERIGIQTK